MKHYSDENDPITGLDVFLIGASMFVERYWPWAAAIVATLAYWFILVWAVVR